MLIFFNKLLKALCLSRAVARDSKTNRTSQIRLIEKQNRFNKSNAVISENVDNKTRSSMPHNHPDPLF